MSDALERIPDHEKQVIAEELQLSPRTIKRALAGSPAVSARTRERVVQARRRLGYGIESNAFVGLIVPDLRNPFFVDLATSLEARLSQRDLMLVTLIADAHAEQELATIERLRSMRVSGVFYARNPPYPGSLHALAGAGIATILLDVDLDEPDALTSLEALQADAVLVDNEAGIDRAVSHLVIEHGHADIAFLAGPDDRTTARTRRAAFERSMGRHDLQTKFLQGDYTFESGRSAALLLEILRRSHGAMPSAIVSANDLMALGLIKGLATIGVGVPDDVSVVGFDNIDLATMWTPELTSVDQRVDKISDAAVGRMYARLGFDASTSIRSAVQDGRTVLRILPALIERRTVADCVRSRP